MRWRKGPAEVPINRSNIHHYRVSPGLLISQRFRQGKLCGNHSTVLRRKGYLPVAKMGNRGISRSGLGFAVEGRSQKKGGPVACRTERATDCARRAGRTRSCREQEPRIDAGTCRDFWTLSEPDPDPATGCRTRLSRARKRTLRMLKSGLFSSAGNPVISPAFSWIR